MNFSHRLALLVLPAILFSSAVRADEEVERPAAPAKTPVAAVEKPAPPTPAAKPGKAAKKKPAKKADSAQGLELAPAPLMIQKP